MTIESALAVKIPVPNVIPFPSDPDFGKGDFFTGELGGKSKIDLLFETYVSERKKIPTKQKQKPFYLSPSECSKFPSSHNGQFAAMLETTRGFKKFEGLSEEILDKFLKYVGERTSKSVGGLVYKTIKTGFNVGIAFANKNDSSYETEKRVEGKECGIIIEVYNASQPVEIYKIDENGKRRRAILIPEKMKRSCGYNGKNFLNAYTLRCKASDLGNYFFSANVKGIYKMDRKPNRLAN